MWFTPALAAPPAPSRPTELRVEVTGAIAEITATRRFHYDGAEPIDAELWFAVPPAAGIDRVVVTVGDRVITSRVEAVDQARQTWLDAANAGRTATLLELADDDLVVQHLANLQPGDDVTVELHLIQTAARRDGVWELVIPLTVAPRLQDPADPGPTYVVTGPDADPRSVPAVERVNAAFAVHAGHWVNWIDAPSHPHQATLDGEDATLRVDGAPANRDLVVRWSTAVQDPSTTAFVAGTHGLLQIEAPAPWARYTRPPRDVVLLIDASDTMVDAWPAAVEAALAVLAGVRPDDPLTVLVFADGVRGLAVRELATPDVTRRVGDRLRALAVGGKSNLALGLSFAEALPIPDGGPRTVVVVSDGGADPVPPPAPGVTVHTVGVGPAPHHALLDRLAREGGGLAVLVTPEDDPAEKVQPIVEALPGPVVDGVSTSWSSTAPRQIPPLYPGQVVTIAAEGVGCGTVVVEGVYLGHPFRELVTPACADANRAIDVTWARLAVRDLADRPDEAQAVALAFGIASPYTSFVGVDDEVRALAVDAETVALARPKTVTMSGSSMATSEYRVAGTTVTQSVADGWFDVLPPRPSLTAAVGGWTGTRPTFVDLGIDRAELPPYARGDTARGGPIHAYLPPAREGLYADATLGAPVAGAAGGSLAAALGGPLDDRAFAWGEITGRAEQVGGIAREQIVGVGRIEGRWWSGEGIRAIVDRDQVVLDGRAVPIGGATAWATVSGPVGTEWAGLSATFDRQELDRARRTVGSAAVEAGPRMQRDVGYDVSARVTRVDWGADPRWVWSGLGSVGWRPRPLSLDVDVRVDAPGGLSPRARLELGDDRVGLAVGYQRTVDLARVLPRGVSDVDAPTAHTASAEARVGRDGLEAGVTGAWSRERLPFVATAIDPPPAAPTVERDVGWVDGWTHAARGRWAVNGSVRRWFSTADARLEEPAAAWVAGYLDPYRSWAASGSVWWDLPTDPWTLSLGVLGRTASAVSTDPGAPWWLSRPSVVGAGARQGVPVPHGVVWVQASISRARNDPGATVLPWEVWYLTGAAPPAQGLLAELSVTVAVGVDDPAR